MQIVYLKLKKEQSYMERKHNSNIMIVTVRTFIPMDTIVPICIYNLIVSEGKVIKSDLLKNESEIKVVLKSDKPNIPQFECCREDCEVVNVNALTKHNFFSRVQKKAKNEHKTILVETRRTSITLLKRYIPDILDFDGLDNLALNVKFKEGINPLFDPNSKFKLL